MTMKCCLVTICIGDKYIQEYNRLFKPFHSRYAKKCGYDFKVITDFISTTKHRNSINMNKWLVCSLEWSKNYDYIIVIDADIIINENTPTLHDYYEFGDKIGCVNQSQPNLNARLEGQIHKGLSEITAKDYYKMHADLNIETDHIINSGVLVFQPKIHKEYLECMVKKFEPNIVKQPSNRHKDQPFFGYQLQMDNKYYFMDMKWNALWANNKYYFNVIKNKNLTLQDFFNMNFFIHLAGKCDYHVIKKLKSGF